MHVCTVLLVCVSENIQLAIPQLCHVLLYAEQIPTTYLNKQNTNICHDDGHTIRMRTVCMLTFCGIHWQLEEQLLITIYKN